jgi:hypothetical protein
MDDILIAAYSAVIADLSKSEGWDERLQRVALSVLVTRRMELENWDTFQEVPD